MESPRRRALSILGLVVFTLVGIAVVMAAHRFLDDPRRYPAISARLRGFEFLGNAGLTLQKHPKYCGPVALYRVLEIYGVRASLDDLGRRMMDQPGGTSVRRLKEVAESYAFIAKARRISAGDWQQIPLPSIALYREQHFLVVESLERGGSVVVFDPSIGRCRISLARLMRNSGGAILLLSRAPAAREEPAAAGNARR